MVSMFFLTAATAALSLGGSDESSLSALTISIVDGGSIGAKKLASCNYRNKDQITRDE